jgi:exoribonuclease R
MQCTIKIHNRQYSSWSFFNEKNEEVFPNVPEHFHPIELKFLTDDKLIIHDSGHITKLHSNTIDTIRVYAGVLVLVNTRTYGRSHNNRLLYKCIPYDNSLPELLVPYDQKITFSKAFKNKYVTFSFSHWEEKHPRGIIRETLGDVDHLPAFYEYQLHSKYIHFSNSKMTKHVQRLISEKHCPDFIQDIFQNPQYSIEDKTEQCYVFTIDPKGSTDLDDAFSIQQCEDNNDILKITVYISNVFVWLETMDLWDHLSQRVSTVYFPDTKRTMLPTILSEDWYSLLEKKKRVAFAMEILVHQDGTILPESLRFYSALICVRKNFAYDEEKLHKNKHYQKLESVSKKLDTNIRDSHDVVSYWMIFMNIQCAKQLRDKKCGIFRNSIMKNKDLTQNTLFSHLDHDTTQMLSMWNNVSSTYIEYNHDESTFQHDVMNEECYIHITSPIRRLVDILNQITFYANVMNTPVSDEALRFLNKWISQMDFLNTSMKSIRSIQNNCDLLYQFTHKPELTEKAHRGVLFDEQIREGGYIYQVYLPELKVTSRLFVEQKQPLFQYQLFSLYLFEEEYQAKRKIRLQLLS